MIYFFCFKLLAEFILISFDFTLNKLYQIKLKIDFLSLSFFIATIQLNLKFQFILFITKNQKFKFEFELKIFYFRKQ